MMASTCDVVKMLWGCVLAEDPSSCWFCLGSPEVEKHLVVSVGSLVSWVVFFQSKLANILLHLSCKQLISVCF